MGPPQEPVYDEEGDPGRSVAEERRKGTAQEQRQQEPEPDAVQALLDEQQEHFLLGAGVLDGGAFRFLHRGPHELRTLGRKVRCRRFFRQGPVARVRAVPPGRLCRIHAFVRKVDERGGIHAFFPLSRSGADRQGEGRAVVVKDCFLDPLTADIRPCGRARQRGAREDQNEFLSAVAGGQFGTPDPVTQHLCEGDDAFIAHRMAVFVVDLLELVEIVQDDGQRGAGPPGVPDARGQFPIKSGPVVKTREAVELGAVDRLLDGRFRQTALLLERGKNGPAQETDEQPDEQDVQKDGKEDLDRVDAVLGNEVEHQAEVQHLQRREHDAGPSLEEQEGDVHGAPVEPVRQCAEPVFPSWPKRVRAGPSVVLPFVVHRHRAPSFHTCTYNSK